MLEMNAQSIEHNVEPFQNAVQHYIETKTEKSKIMDLKREAIIPRLRDTGTFINKIVSTLLNRCSNCDLLIVLTALNVKYFFKN